MIMQDLFIHSQRRTGDHRPILVIDPLRYDEFFKRLRDEPNVPLYFKTYLAFALSGGLRISEALSVRLCDVKLDAAIPQYEVTVLKKDSKKHKVSKFKVKREVVLHPVAVELLKQYLAATPKLKFYSKLFSFSRSHAHAYIQKLFGYGACPHSVTRHSHISWLHEQGESTSTISRLVEIAECTTQAYNHVNRVAKMQSLYKKSA